MANARSCGPTILPYPGCGPILVVALSWLWLQNGLAAEADRIRGQAATSGCFPLCR